MPTNETQQGYGTLAEWRGQVQHALLEIDIEVSHGRMDPNVAERLKQTLLNGPLSVNRWVDGGRTEGYQTASMRVGLLLQQSEKARLEAGRRDESGLYKKTFFENELMPGFIELAARDARARPYNQGRYELAAFWFLDLDHLKLINEVVSYPVGTRMINRISALIVLASRNMEGEGGGRLGGDEFGFLLKRIKNQEETIGHASRVKREFDSTDWPLVDERLVGYLRPSVSIGVAIIDLGSLWGYGQRSVEIAEKWLVTASSLMKRAKRKRYDRPAAVAYRWNGEEFVEIHVSDTYVVRVEEERTP